MNSKKSLKSTSLLLFLGICLIFIGLFVISSNKNKIVQVIPTPSTAFAKVIYVIDGDTIVIEGGQHIRYIGINTPEIETNECFATEASEINKNLVLGKIVKLEKDISDTDKYGRLLRYVFVDNNFINNELIKNGSAREETIKPDTKYESEFVTWQKFAKQNNLGLWGKCQ
jgi:micrococcal nuclease